MPEYTVQRGDTLSGIARRHGTTVKELVRLNPQVKNPDRISVGEVVATPSHIPAPRRRTREATASSPPSSVPAAGGEAVVTVPDIHITGDPDLFPRARRLNRHYARHPPLPGWPYDDQLRALWLGEAHDDFIAAVREYQVEVMGATGKAADGILGPKTAAALRTRPMIAYEPIFAAAAPAESATPPASLPDDRLARQEAALREARELHAMLAAAFRTVDTLLPPTKVYEAYATIRERVMADAAAALDAAEIELNGTDPGGRAEAIRTSIEQARLWLFYLPYYAHLAALMRAAEADHLVPGVITVLSQEAALYEGAFSVIAKGTAEDLAVGREKALALAEHTREQVEALRTQVEAGQQAIDTLHWVTLLVDVPLQFASGVVAPMGGMIPVLVTNYLGFGHRHFDDLAAIEEHGPAFLGEWRWLHDNAPRVRRHILSPLYDAIPETLIEGATLPDGAFILGRLVRALVKGQSSGAVAGAGRITLKALARVLRWVGPVWATAVRSPKFLALGIGPTFRGTAEELDAAVGGAGDPHGAIAALNALLDEPLAYADALALLQELAREDVQGHLERFAEAGGALLPHLDAIVGDLAASGMATEATAGGALKGMAIPLLAPAP